MNSHPWKFFRAGGFDQVRLENGADLAHLEQLDQKLWVALACPTTGLEFDSKTLALIDTDKDGRIRAPEIIGATKWATSSLKNPDDLLKGSPSLPLAAINDATPEGKQLLSSARQILTNLGKKDADSISIEDTTDTTKIFAQTRFNGDGIIPPEAAEEPALQSMINDIISCVGGETDRSGKVGLSADKAKTFFAEAQFFSDWWKLAESDATILPLDGSTETAASAFKAVKSKIEDYFTRCRLAAFDPRAVVALNREEKEYLTFAAKDLTLSSAEIAGFPLAQVAAGKALPLREGVNPAWSDAMTKFEIAIVKPILNGKSSITESDWQTIRAKFTAYEAWAAAKKGAVVEKLGIKRVREILGGKSQEEIAALIAKDKALEPEANAIAAVDRLVRYHRDLYKLLNNFVSFRDFYRRKDKAIFQAGTLYLDQRSCELCLPVEDAGRHALMAGLAGTYLAYCECVRKATSEKMQIVAAFTDGDSDNLMAGRNGIFYDRKGKDWDATISKIVDNPISIRQAFWSPYKKFVRAIEEQIAKRAAAADASASDKLAQAAANMSRADIVAEKNKAAAEQKKVDVGTVAAMGVAVGAIGGAAASLATGVLRLPVWQIPLVFIGLILLISLPSMIIAWLKLRKRNLGPILDANGWAVNARARMNVPFGASLTQVATIPPGSHFDRLTDPFADKKSPWPRVIVAALILVFAYVILSKMGYIYDWTNGRLGEPKQTKAQRESAAKAPAAPEAPKASAPEAPTKPAEPAR